MGFFDRFKTKAKEKQFNGNLSSPETNSRKRGAGFMEFFRSRIKKGSDSAKAYQDLESGHRIVYTPRSKRYTYENQEDMSFDKSWKPETAQERKTLSPEGYFRVGEREDRRKELQGNMSDDDFNRFYDRTNVSVDSTALKKIDYNPVNEALTVQFQGGSKDYLYPAVPLELVQSLLKAPSKGEFFMANIHDQYTMNPGHKPSGNSPEKAREIKNIVKQIALKKYKQ